MSNFYIKKNFSSLCWQSFYQKIKSIRITSIACYWYLRASSWSIELPVGIQIGQNPSKTYRFSAFWLRSKCSICSYQLNIWYSPHCGLRILNWFLPDRLKAWACSASVAGCYSIALPLYCSLFKKIINYLTLIFLNDPPFCLNLYLFSWPCQIFCSFCTMPWVRIRKISFTYYSLLDSHQDNERGRFCGKCRYLTLPFHCSWPKLVVRSQSLNKLVLAQDMWALISLTSLSWSN